MIPFRRGHGEAERWEAISRLAHELLVISQRLLAGLKSGEIPRMAPPAAGAPRGGPGPARAEPRVVRRREAS